MQMNLFNLHCRGATGYVAKPNIEEAESNLGGATGYVAKPNIEEAESLPRDATSWAPQGLSSKPLTLEMEVTASPDTKYLIS